MSENITVELRIVEQTFRLATPSDKEEELRHACDLLNEKYHGFRRKAPNLEQHKLMTMVALDLMQEVLSLNKTLQSYTHAERVLTDIMDELEE
jgi:cell division protein ZapA